MGSLGGAISGALALGSTHFISRGLGVDDPVMIISDLVGGTTVAGLTLGAAVGAVAGILLGLVTMSAARVAQRIIFACALCPAASLCIDVWVLARALPLVPMLIGSWIYAACVACLLPRSG